VEQDAFEPRRPAGWPLRFYEAVVRLGGELPDGREAKAIGRAPIVYDVDPVVAYLSSVEEWVDPSDLPTVEPPPATGGPVLADFVLPDATAERSEELRRRGGMAAAEEWWEDISHRPRDDVIGCLASPGKEDARLERLTRRSPEVARAWRVLVTLAGWEASDGGETTLREKQTYDWLIGVSEEGCLAGKPLLDLAGRDLGAAEAQERELWEHYGMALLYPFLFSFALLACENVRGLPVSEGRFDPDPVYLRPVLEADSTHRTVFPPGRFARPEYGEPAGRSGNAFRWDPDE
jgi:hypothetical protein